MGTKLLRFLLSPLRQQHAGHAAEGESFQEIRSTEGLCQRSDVFAHLYMAS